VSTLTEEVEIGEVQVVWQTYRSPATAKEWSVALGGAEARTVRVEDAIDRLRL